MARTAKTNSLKGKASKAKAKVNKQAKPRSPKPPKVPRISRLERLHLFWNPRPDDLTPDFWETRRGNMILKRLMDDVEVMRALPPEPSRRQLMACAKVVCQRRSLGLEPLRSLVSQRLGDREIDPSRHDTGAENARIQILIDTRHDHI